MLLMVQGIQLYFQNGSQILVLYLTVSKTEAEENDIRMSEVNDTRYAAELLSDRGRKR